VTATITELRPRPDTVHWGFQDGTLPAVETVADGGVLRVRTIQGSPEDPVPAEWIADDVRAIVASGCERGPGPHIVTGPVAVEGAEVGDVVTVDLLEVRLGARYGINRIRPGVGLLPDVAPPGAPVDSAAIEIDIARSVGRVQPGLEFPLRPFFGIIATAPDPAWGRLSTVEPRANGGNLDCTMLTTGARLHLPVFVPGANVSVGDGHGAQGDGEVDQTAVETCLEGDLRLSVLRGVPLAAPVAVTPSSLVTMGLGASLEEAARDALDHLLRLLEVHVGLSRRDGYRLASLVVDLRITQVVNRVVGVHAVLGHDVLAQLDPPAWMCPHELAPLPA